MKKNIRKSLILLLFLLAPMALFGTTLHNENYLDGVTSNIQTLLNTKANLSGGNAFTGNQTVNGAIAATSVSTPTLTTSDITAMSITIVDPANLASVFPGFVGRRDLPPTAFGDGLISWIKTPASTPQLFTYTSGTVATLTGSTTNTVKADFYYRDSAITNTYRATTEYANNYTYFTVPDGGAAGVMAVVDDGTQKVLRYNQSAYTNEFGGTFYLDRITATTVTTTKTDIRVSGWIKTTTTSGHYESERSGLIGIGICGFNATPWVQFIGMGVGFDCADSGSVTNAVGFVGRNLIGGGRTRIYESNKPIADGNWHFLEVVIDGSTGTPTWSGYIDGVKICDHTTQANMDGITSTLDHLAWATNWNGSLTISPVIISYQAVGSSHLGNVEGWADFKQVMYVEN